MNVSLFDDDVFKFGINSDIGGFVNYSKYYSNLIISTSKVTEIEFRIFQTQSNDDIFKRMDEERQNINSNIEKLRKNRYIEMI